MEVETLVFLCALIACSFVSTSSSLPCPLQCSCVLKESRKYVTCDESEFKVLPQFPDDTYHIRIANRGEKIYSFNTGSLSNMKQVKYVQFQSSVKWVLPQGVLSELSSIRHIGLVTTNRLIKNDVSDDIFSGTNLDSIHITINHPDLPYDNICTNRNLTHLDISYNNIKSAKLHNCFTKMVHIYSLILTQNKIPVIKRNDLEIFKRSKLQGVRLNSCGLEQIESGAFRFLSNLKDLRMDSNKLKCIRNGMFSGLPSLETLDISGNSIQKLSCDAFNDIDNISYLNLDGVEGIIKDKLQICRNFETMRNLYEVQIQHVKFVISNWTILGPLTRVSSVRASFETAKNISLEPNITMQWRHFRYVNVYSTFAKAFTFLTLLNKSAVETIHIANPGKKDCSQHLFTLNSKMLLPISNSTLRQLVLQNGGIADIEKRSLDALPNLEHLDLTKNCITRLQAGLLQYLTSLKAIFLGGNYISELNISALGLQSLVEHISLSQNAMTNIVGEFKNLPNLKVLNLAGNKLTKIGTLFCVTLKELYLSDNNIHVLTNDPFKYLRNLEVLEMNGGGSMVLSAQQKWNPFRALVKIKSLIVPEVTFSTQFKKNVFPELFRPFSFISIAHFTHNNIEHLSLNMFSTNTQLEELILNQNRILTWDPSVFKPVKLLRYLSLSRNEITYISRELFRYLQSLEKLDLAGNPFFCNCDMLWFNRWVTTIDIFMPDVTHSRSYHCGGPDRYRGIRLLDFQLPASECQSFLALSMGITFATIVVLAIIGSGLVYRYRFTIQFLLYKMRTRNTTLIDDQGEPYDALLIYAKEDLNWIVQELLPQMEVKRGYRLCLEDRDWPPGHGIVDNLMESMENSRRVILVISSHFTAAPWCEEFFLIAQSCLAGRMRAAMIPIVLQEPAAHEMIPAIRALLSSHSCLYWPRHDKYETKFWKTLNSNLKKRMQPMMEIH